MYYGIDDKNVAHNINVSVNGQNVAPEYDGNIICVRVPNISISLLGDTYNVKVKSKFVCKFIFQLCGFIYATFIFKRFD